MPCGTKKLATNNNCTKQEEEGSGRSVPSRLEGKNNCLKQKEKGRDKNVTLKLAGKNACNKTKETGARGLKNKLLREKIRGTEEIWTCNKTNKLQKLTGKEIDYEDRFLIGKMCAKDETSIKKY